MKRKLIFIIIVTLLLYITSYIIFRQTHVEKWDKDNNNYVIFPKSQVWVYYLYRPATYIDSKLTPIRFHIGPHQDN